MMEDKSFTGNGTPIVFAGQGTSSPEQSTSERAFGEGETGSFA